MKNNQAYNQNKCEMDDRTDGQKDEIKSLFCYGDEKNKKMIWKLKTDPKFCVSDDGKNLMKRLSGEISGRDAERWEVSQEVAWPKVRHAPIIIAPPSSSYWQSKKGFDHMHVFMKKISKTYGYKYIPHAIIPKLAKGSQKLLNKKERQDQSCGAYTLSNYFKYFLKTALKAKATLTSATAEAAEAQVFEILIIDDVKTTGSTVIECIKTVERYVSLGHLSSENNVNVSGMTIAYEA